MSISYDAFQSAATLLKRKERKRANSARLVLYTVYYPDVLSMSANTHGEYTHSEGLSHVFGCVWLSSPAPI